MQFCFCQRKNIIFLQTQKKQPKSFSKADLQTILSSAIILKKKIYLIST